MSKCEWCCYSNQVIITDIPIEDKITQYICEEQPFKIEYICTKQRCLLSQEQINKIIKLGGTNELHRSSKKSI